MTDGADILAKTLADPADDHVRLVYADWLQEHGDETRAQFIRDQIRVHAMHGPGAYARGILADAERDLLRWHSVWRPQLGIPYQAWKTIEPGWERGFIAHVTCSAADWLAHADSILAVHPVTRVTLTTRPEVVEDEHLLYFLAQPIQSISHISAAYAMRPGEVDLILGYLRVRFGGTIEFELPPPTIVTLPIEPLELSPASEAFVDYYERMLGEMIRPHGLPPALAAPPD